tara:strand:- start:115 stop:339 length:225 start_codon:yes stop_codon:yes gene_type:complete
MIDIAVLFATRIGGNWGNGKYGGSFLRHIFVLGSVFLERWLLGGSYYEVVGLIVIGVIYFNLCGALVNASACCC